jgi:hypothetical protein
MASQPNIRRAPQTASNFDVSDRPSMGDPEFVEGRVRVMLDEARRLLFESPNPKAGVPALVERWAKEFSPDNPDYIQTMSVEGLNIFLRARGMGTDDAHFRDPVRALIATSLNRFLDASLKFHSDELDEEQLKFEIDTCVEDTVALIRGLDNTAD